MMLAWGGCRKKQIANKPKTITIEQQSGAIETLKICF
jgi:hypothetical protein